ncbi:hypothetical protein QTP86_005629 [Hemibagrus guttatus]|nr:hypothetical protein QTP86_005629 [Hemibagrus guttatus]
MEGGRDAVCAICAVVGWSPLYTLIRFYLDPGLGSHSWVLGLTGLMLQTFCLPPTTFLFSPPSPALRKFLAATASGGQLLQNTLPPMDPAELREIIVRQGALIRSYQDQVEALQSQLKCLRSTSTAAPPPLQDPPAARV